MVFVDVVVITVDPRNLLLRFGQYAFSYRHNIAVVVVILVVVLHVVVVHLVFFVFFVDPTKLPLKFG